MSTYYAQAGNRRKDKVVCFLSDVFFLPARALVFANRRPLMAAAITSVLFVAAAVPATVAVKDWHDEQTGGIEIHETDEGTVIRFN